MYQQIIIVGRLGADPEHRFLPNGTPVCNFPVAVTTGYKDNNGERQERTTWFRIATFGQLATTCNDYLHKGRRVMVVGEVGVSTWTDREGNPRATLELRARDVRFLDAPTRTDEEGQEETGEELL